MSSTRGRDGSLPVSMRNATKEKVLAKTVSYLRKARDEELEELRRNRATNSNPFFKLNHSDVIDSNATVDSNSTPCSGTKSMSQKRAASDFASLNSSDTFHSNFKRLSTTKSISSQNSYAFSLDQFYKEQRKKAYIDKKKKSEAAERLRTYSSSIFDQSMISARISLSNAKKFENAMSKKYNPNGTRMTKAMTNFFANSDFRAFVFVTHETFGMLLLHCTKKKKKGPHFQVPGGHIDPSEFVAAAELSGGDPRRQLILAAKNAAARELCEETGIDVSHDLKRLAPAILRFDFECNNELNCEHRNRLFFYLDVSNSDFFTPDDQNSAKLCSSLDKKAPQILLKLSSEHSGFKFQKDLNIAVKELEKHSDGACAKALRMAIHQKTAKMPDRKTIQSIVKAIEDDNKTAADQQENSIPTSQKEYKYNTNNGNISQQENIINNIEAISLLRSPDSKPKDLIGFTFPLLPDQDLSDDSRNSVNFVNSTASQVSAVTDSIHAPHSPSSQNLSFHGEIDSLETDRVHHENSEDSMTEASKQKNPHLTSPRNAQTPQSNTNIEEKTNESNINKNSSFHSVNSIQDQNKNTQSLFEKNKTLKLESISFEHTNDSEKNMNTELKTKNIPFVPYVSVDRSTLSDKSLKHDGITNEESLLPRDEKRMINSAKKRSGNEMLLGDNINVSSEPDILLNSPNSSNPIQTNTVSSNKEQMGNNAEKSTLNESSQLNLNAHISKQRKIVHETSHQYSNEHNSAQSSPETHNLSYDNAFSPCQAKVVDVNFNEQNNIDNNLSETLDINSSSMSPLHENYVDRDAESPIQSFYEDDIYSSDEDEEKQDSNIFQAFACTFCWQKSLPEK